MAHPQNLRSITVGIDGPVLAGKSTVIEAMVNRLGQRRISCFAAPCFVEAALTQGFSLPNLIPRDIAEQVSAVRFYLDIDRLRRRVPEAEIVFLDRTSWTLLAHTTAIAKMGLIDAVAQVEMSLSSSELNPTVLIYLDVSHSEQLLRSVSRQGMPELLLNKAFNDAFRACFRSTQNQHQAYWVDADRKIPEVLDIVEAHLFRQLDIQC